MLSARAGVESRDSHHSARIDRCEITRFVASTSFEWRARKKFVGSSLAADVSSLE